MGFSFSMAGASPWLLCAPNPVFGIIFPSTDFSFVVNGIHSEGFADLCIVNSHDSEALGRGFARWGVYKKEIDDR